MVAINLKERFKNGELDLSSCGLKEIPKEINTLKHITSLNLSNNKISSLGKIIGSLPHLNKVDLSRNQIKGLPENIGNLSNLKYLNLSHNQIATLPSTLGNLKNLKHLDLKNNNLASKFSEIVGSCQNESQCQQAAKNVLKAFSSQSDSDKKKKQNSVFSAIKNSVTLLFFVIFTIVSAVYLLSFYDEDRYKAIVTQFRPVWRSASARVLGDESAMKVEAGLVEFGVRLNVVCEKVVRTIIVKSKTFYQYVTTDETIQQYVSNVKNTTKELWAKVTSGGGEQKS